MEPGFTSVKKRGVGYQDMKSGMKALMIAGALPDADFKSDFLVVMTSHLSGLAGKADVVLPLAALYEQQGSIVNTYGKVKTITQSQPAVDEAKDGADIAAELSQVISKARGFKLKDVAAATKKLKSGKMSVPSFKPVEAKAVKSAAASSAAILASVHEGMLSGSAVAAVVAVKQPMLQK